MLHEFFMLNLFSPLVVTFDLVLELFHPISFVSVFRKFLSAEIISIEQLLLK